MLIRALNCTLQQMKSDFWTARDTLLKLFFPFKLIKYMVIKRCIQRLEDTVWITWYVQCINH